MCIRDRNVIGVKEIRALQKIAVEETRLGIPLIFGHDVIHGYKTMFPIPLALKSISSYAAKVTPLDHLLFS